MARAGRKRKCLLDREPSGRVKRRPVPPVPGVYFVSMGDGSRSTKVGVTVNLADRMHDLQVGCPEELMLRCFVQFVDADTARIAERALHRHFQTKGKRVRGEWFILDDEDIARAVASLKQLLGPAVAKWMIAVGDDVESAEPGARRWAFPRWA